ncbi:MAG TPA: hypothetical protein EYN95_02160, partial [Methylococcaceae bacterium]|nr:hypothetical protein [Methylococcaceae bacterium]
MGQREILNLDDATIASYGLNNDGREYTLQIVLVDDRFQFDNDTLRAAVQLWLRNPGEAKHRHGHISDWHVFNVTD